jgi:hypothetical protein
MPVTKDRQGAAKISFTWIASRNSLPLTIFPSSQLEQEVVVARGHSIDN